jgi:hypothetical protein
MGEVKSMADTVKETPRGGLSKKIKERKEKDDFFVVTFKLLDRALNFSQTPSFQNFGFTSKDLKLMYTKLTAMEKAYNLYRNNMPKQPAGLNLDKYAALIVKDGGTTTPTLGEIKAKMIEVNDNPEGLENLNKYLDEIDAYHAKGDNLLDIHTKRIDINSFDIISVSIYENFKFLFK